MSELCTGLKIVARRRSGPARLQIGNPGPARPVGNVAAPYEKQLQVRYFHSFGSPKTYLLDLETGDFPRISGPARPV